MSSPRSWSEQEQYEKSIILQKFWDQRVLSTDAKQRERSINAIKNQFLLALPAPGFNQNEWIDKVNKAWADGSAFKSSKIFFEFFSHIHSVTSVGLAENLMPQPTIKNEAVDITDAERKTLQQYTKDRNIAVTAMMGSVKTKTIEVCPKDYKTSDVFSIESVSKVFTGVLALRLLEEKIISEADLKSTPLKIEKSAEDLLAQHSPLVLEQMKKVSLHQALTHYAGLGVGKDVGLGDYYSLYIGAIKAARRTGQSFTAVNKIEDFIPFIPNQISTPGTVGSEHYHYSNSGIVLGALSLEYLYNKNRNLELEPEPLSFNEIMKKYVTGPKEAKMSYFESSPKGLGVKFNPDDLNTKHMIGSPGGGYYSSAESLTNFAKWIYEKCQDPHFTKLIEQYGQEFCPYPQSKTIEHSGDGPSNSAFFSLNWGTGNFVILLNDQRAFAATEVGRAIKNNIMSEKPSDPSLEKEKKKKSTAIIASTAGIDLLSPTPVVAEKAKLHSPQKQFKFSKKSSVDVSDEEMAKSAFGQGSYTAKKNY